MEAMESVLLRKREAELILAAELAQKKNTTPYGTPVQ